MEAEFHFLKAMEYYSQIPDYHVSASVELHLQWMLFDSGQEVDLNQIIGSTRYLIEKGEMIGVVGFGLIEKLLGKKCLTSMLSDWNSGKTNEFPCNKPQGDKADYILSLTLILLPGKEGLWG